LTWQEQVQVDTQLKLHHRPKISSMVTPGDAGAAPSESQLGQLVVLDHVRTSHLFLLLLELPPSVSTEQLRHLRQQKG